MSQQFSDNVPVSYGRNNTNSNGNERARNRLLLHTLHEKAIVHKTTTTTTKRSSLPGSFALKRLKKERFFNNNIREIAAGAPTPPLSESRSKNNKINNNSNNNNIQLPTKLAAKLASTLPTKPAMTKVTTATTTTNGSNSRHSSSSSSLNQQQQHRRRHRPSPFVGSGVSSSSSINSRGSRSSKSSKGSSRTRRTVTLSSPYEANYNAEDNESLFEDLEEAIRAAAAAEAAAAASSSTSPSSSSSSSSSIFKLSVMIRTKSTPQVLYDPSWMESLLPSLKQLEPEEVVLCLNKHLFYEADASSLKQLVKTTNMEAMVKDLVTTFQEDSTTTAAATKYPKIVDASSRLVVVDDDNNSNNSRKEEDVLKSIVFLARIHCAKKFLGEEAKISKGLNAKLDRTLEIVDAGAVVTTDLTKTMPTATTTTTTTTTAAAAAALTNSNLVPIKEEVIVSPATSDTTTTTTTAATRTPSPTTNTTTTPRRVSVASQGPEQNDQEMVMSVTPQLLMEGLGSSLSRSSSSKRRHHQTEDNEHLSSEQQLPAMEEEENSKSKTTTTPNKRRRIIVQEEEEEDDDDDDDCHLGDVSVGVGTDNKKKQLPPTLSLNDLKPNLFLEALRSGGEALTIEKLNAVESHLKKLVEAVQFVKADLLRAHDQKQQVKMMITPKEDNNNNLLLQEDASPPTYQYTRDGPQTYSSSAILEDSDANNDEDVDDNDDDVVRFVRRKTQGTRVRNVILEDDDDEEDDNPHDNNNNNNHSGSSSSQRGNTVGSSATKAREMVVEAPESSQQKKKPPIQLPLKKKVDPPVEEEVDKAFLKSIDELVKSKVFRNVKFFKDKTHLRAATKFVAERIPNGLPDGMSQESFVNDHGGTVERAVAKLRNSIQGRMKKVVHEYLDDNDGFLPSVEELALLRKSSTPYELDVFHWFWTSLLECVSGDWAAKKRTILMSSQKDVVSTSDEAFALLAYENYREVWVAAWRQDGESTQAKTLYTRTGPRKKGKNPFTWSSAADVRFKQLLSMVKSQRKEDAAAGNKAEKYMLSRAQKGD